jgi:hypothetical protein
LGFFEILTTNDRRVLDRMSIFKNRTGLGLARKARAFLYRGPGTDQALRKLERQERETAALRALLAKRDAGQKVGIRPENIVWVFGSGRTGSSWLTFMMGALSDHTRWNEPLVGYLFGHLYYERNWTRQYAKHFILGDEYGEYWLSSIRNLVLEGGTARFPERAEKGYLVKGTARLHRRATPYKSPAGEPDGLLGPGPKGCCRVRPRRSQEGQQALRAAYNETAGAL